MRILQAFCLLCIVALVISCKSDHKHGPDTHTHDHHGHDHSGHDHSGHNHDGHDHSGHDHTGHDHGSHHGSAAKTESALLDDLSYPQEKHFKNIRQLTFGGDNAEAYWSFDDQKLVFQAKNEKWNAPCDQIYLEDFKRDRKTVAPLLSTGKGRTTCSYFMPGNQNVLYASTHHYNENCPPEPPRGDKYVWPIYETFDIFVADLKGNITAQLTDNPGYDAEATVSPNGDLIVYTSTKSGDLELWTMNIDGSDKKQVTHGLGYDGGAFFSPDGKELIFRASRPETEAEKKEYKDLLEQGLVQPTEMELYVCNVDGSNLRQITDLGKANWAPFFHPSGKKVIFSSNHKSERGFPFNLYMINVDGTGLEQISFDEAFDSFPMFSFDGKKLAFSSNRNNGGTRETNMFVADWVE
jgi:Tol biopolymer transport system component